MDSDVFYRENNMEISLRPYEYFLSNSRCFIRKSLCLTEISTGTIIVKYTSNGFVFRNGWENHHTNDPFEVVKFINENYKERVLETVLNDFFSFCNTLDLTLTKEAIGYQRNINERCAKFKSV